MQYRAQDIIEVVDDVVKSIRTTGQFVGTYANNITTCVGSNDLRQYDVIDINGTDYVILSANANQFTVSGNVSAYTEYTSKAPYFLAGHVLEIANTLKQRDAATNTFKWQKYPLIILQLDTKSDYDVTTRAYTFPSLTIYICTITNPNYKALERKANNFDTILIPLYERLMSGLSKHQSIYPNAKNYTHSKYDRYFWGAQTNQNSTKNILNDYLDAVEISNLSLTVKKQFCKI